MPDKEIVNPYGQFFSGEGVEIEMAIFNEKNENGLQDVLLLFTGREAYTAGIDNKVIKYKAVPGGTGCDYLYEKDGKTLTRMISRSSYGSWTYFEVFLNNKTIKVSPDELRAKEVRPLHLLTAYKQGE